jgi:hypothetical protein
MSRSVESFDAQVKRHALESLFPHAAIFVLVLGAISCAYFTAAISIAANKNLWMDEALAVSTARLSSWQEIWSAIWSGAEFSQPTYHFFLHELLARFSSYPEAFVARVPSILAVYIAGVCVFALVRASTSPYVALIAMGVTLDSGLFAYATQARQYAPLAAGLALSLVLWNGIRADRFALYRSAGLWLILSACLSLHFYGFIAASTIGLAELIWLLARREMRWSVWLALLAAAPVEAAWYPLGQHLKGFLLQDSEASDYYGKPTVGVLVEAIFQSLASDESVAVLTVFALALAGAACILARVRPRPSIVAVDPVSTSGAEITRLEITAIALFSIPFVAFLFSLLASSSFAVRYASAASLFPGVLYGCAMRRTPYRNWIACLLAPLVAGSLLMRQEDFNSGLLAPAQSVLAATAEKPLPIVVGDGLLFIELMEGADARTRSQLVFLLSPPETISSDPTNENQVKRLAVIHREYHVREQSAFLSETPCFYELFRSSSGSDATTASLMRQGLLQAPLLEEGGVLLFRGGSGCL